MNKCYAKDFYIYTQYIGHMAIFLLYWWSALPYIILDTSGHLSINADVPLASWIASSHERFQKSGFEPTAVRGKWFEVSDLSNMATNAHLLKKMMPDHKQI
jgi:hypothetical protein